MGTRIPGTEGRYAAAEARDERAWKAYEQAMSLPVRIINLTPHVVRVRSAEGGYVEYPPSGNVARVSMTHTATRRLADAESCVVPTYRATYGEVEGLPEYDWQSRAYRPDSDYDVSEYTGARYIVSAMVAAAIMADTAATTRRDLLVPATGHPDCERRNGQVYAVPGFIIQ